MKQLIILLILFFWLSLESRCQKTEEIVKITDFYPDEWHHYKNVDFLVDKNHCWYDVTKRKYKKIISFKYSNHDSLSQITVYRTHLKSQEKVVYFFNHDSKSDIEINKCIFRTEDSVNVKFFRYNEGRLSSLVKKDENGNQIENVKFYYDSDILESQVRTYKGVKTIYEYSYDSAGNMSTYFVQNGKKYVRYAVSGSKPRIIRRDFLFGNKLPDYESILTYDENENLTRGEFWSNVNTNDPLVYIEEYSYNEFGDLSSISFIKEGYVYMVEKYSYVENALSEIVRINKKGKVDFHYKRIDSN